MPSNVVYTEQDNFKCPICNGELIKFIDDYRKMDDDSLLFFCKCENGHNSNYWLVSIAGITSGYYSYIDPNKKEYHEYLKSETWKERSKQAKENAGWKCQLCNKEGVLHTHHRTYENLGHEKDGDLIVLCSDCHAKFHNKVK